MGLKTDVIIEAKRNSISQRKVFLMKGGEKMRKRIKFVLGLILAGIILVFAGRTFSSKAFYDPNVVRPPLMARKIIVFKPGVLDETAREKILEKVGGVRLKNLSLISGKAVLLSPQAVEVLRKEAGVLRIDDDVVVEALARPTRLVRPTATPTSKPAQVLPWGIDRIDADLVWQTSSGSAIKVAVIDTGIDVKHPDLKDNLKGGVSTVWYTGSYNDDNGHGTHVAGIAAALNNTIGVVGVGPQIDLYGIKVLDRNGSGYLSDVIEGLDWAIQNKMQVVNMSLGTTSDVQSFRDAVQRVNTAGIVQVAAAGNSGGAVIFPAAYSQVIAVSATDKTDTIASWSSRGLEVDLAAPGVSIYSTYKGQTYKTLSGTSMASPHVAGVAALVLTQTAKCDSDLNGVCSPIEVQQRLEATARDLGDTGRDNLYGAGLVDAWQAVTQ